MFGSTMKSRICSLQRSVVIGNRLVGGLQDDRAAVEALNRASVELREQVVIVLCDDVDELLVQRFLVGKGLRFANGGLGDSHVASALADVRANESRQIVLDLGSS